MNWRKFTALTAACAISGLCGLTAEAEGVPFLQCSAPDLHTSATPAAHQMNQLCALLPSVQSGECASALLTDLRSRDPLLARGPSQIVVIEQPQVNAYLIDPVRIGITRGMLDRASARSEIEFVLAHELGHYVLNSISGNFLEPVRTGHEQERLADQYASWLTGFYRVRASDSLAISVPDARPETVSGDLRVALRPEKLRDLRY